jgi:hypothetical protein
LKVPLLNLPCPCRLFQKEDVNIAKADFMHQQLVDRYHTIASTIEAGFSTNVILLASALVRTTLDLIAHILQGVFTTRNFGPNRETLDQDEFKKLFNDEDWEAVKHNLTNLEHLTHIFPSPLHHRETLSDPGCKRTQSPTTHNAGRRSHWKKIGLLKQTTRNITANTS